MLTKQWTKPIACWLLAGMTAALAVGCYPEYEREGIEEEEGLEDVEGEGLEGAEEEGLEGVEGEGIEED